MNIKTIQQKIYEIREQKVMLDFDLAELYQVPTKALNQAAKRNTSRFPKDFMFRLTKKEWNIIVEENTMRSQFVTASQKRRNINITPYAFTEHGVTMLASVLKSEKAVKMNIAIVRAFITLKEFIINYKELAWQLRELQRTVGQHDGHLKELYEALEVLLKQKQNEIDWEKRDRIGFKK